MTSKGWASQFILFSVKPELAARQKEKLALEVLFNFIQIVCMDVCAFLF